MSDLKIQGETQISTEGAEQALDRLADKAGQMAKRMATEGDKAGKAVDGIGAGADKSAEQFTRAEGRMSESIKRATKNLQELGKTASQKIELRIAEKNLDPARFEPMLVKLRELEAAQIKVATSAPRMGGGLQNASYQMQDFIVQVNGGTDATRALSMQLPQMLIGFGAAGAAIGVVAALLPNLISAFGGAGENTKKFSDAMSDFDKAIGDVGATVKKFDLDPLYEQFNDSSAAVRAATIEQIKFQQEYIKTTQLVAQKKFGETLGGLGGYGTLDKLIGAAGNTQAENLAKQLGVQLDVAQELLPVLRGLNKGTEDIGFAFEKTGQKLLGGNQRAVDLAKSLADMAKAERDAAAASSALSEAQEKMAKGHVTTKKEAKEVADLAKKQAEELENLLNTINAKSADFDPNYVKNVETLLMAFDRGALKLGAFNDVFARYVAMQPGAVAAEKERAKALDAAWKAEVKLIEELGKETDTLEKQVAQARLENEQIGLTKEQLNTLKLARLDDAIATKEQALAMAEKHSTGATEIELIRDQVEALKELRAVTASSQVKQAAADTLKEQQKAWEKFTDDIERSLTDSLYRSFEAGEDFGQAFVKSLQNTLKTTVLKVAVQGVMSVAGSAASSLLNSAGIGGGSSGIGSLLSAGNSAYSLLGGNSLYGSFAASSLGQSMGLSLGSLSGPTLTGEALSGTAFTSLGTALPYVAAALAVASLFMKDGGGPKTTLYGGDRTVGSLTAAGYALQDPALDSLLTGVEDTLTSIARSYETALPSLQLGLVAQSDPAGDSADGGGVIYSLAGADQTYLAHNYARGTMLSSENLNKIAGEAVVDILRRIDLSPIADKYLDALSPSGMSAEQLQAVVATVQAIDNFSDAMKRLLPSIDDAVLSGLADAFGGFDLAGAAAAQYYDALYSDVEKLAIAQASLAQQFAALNLTVPETRDEFRAITESIDLTTAAGQSMFASLTALIPAFTQVTDAAAAANSAWQALTDDIFGTADDIRAEMGGGSAAVSLSALQAQFAIAQAQAMAGDQGAADKLPELSRSIIDAAEINAASLTDLRRIQAQTAAALEAVGLALADRYDLTLPQFAAGTNYVPRSMLAEIHAGERILPAADNRALMDALANPNRANDVLVAEVKALRQEMVMLRAEAQATARHTSKTAQALDRVMPDGDALAVRTTP